MDKTFIQKNLTTILIVGATLILGGIAVFTAIRLYQLRSEPVAPNVPESVPQAANEGVILSIPIDSVVRGPGEHELATQKVDEYSGLVCTVTVTGRNQESVHPDNNLIVSSGSGSVVLENVEGEAGGTISANGVLTLGNSVTVKLDMGPDEVFSAGMDVSLDCIVPTSTPEPSLTSCTELTFTLASTTATATATATATSTATATPTTTATSTSTSTATATATSTATSSPTSAPTVSATATPTPATLPQAGVSAPTILGLGAGILLLVVALAFAL
jgi:hypothetical protein